MNFNSSSINGSNNNNRCNGYSVRGVASLQHFIPFITMLLTKELLKLDLLIAFYDARKHKASKSYVKRFESNLNENIDILCDELFYRKYKPEPSMCFIIECPKKREIFAANFRDRIVHHLYFNYTHNLYERTFIYDSYSCRKDKGTHFGIKRLTHFIKSESLNYTKTTYCLKLDIKGYFMNINRNILLSLSLNTLKKYEYQYKDELDFDFLFYLTETIVLINPIKNCYFNGNSLLDYIGLPKTKTLRYSNKDCGLPIGNLTSLLLSNVYLNVLDLYCKRVLKCKCYGRYVDDFYIISNDKNYLLSIIPKIRVLLKESLGLSLQEGKTKISNVNYGIEFLGAFVKPYRNYISNQSLRRMYKHIQKDIVMKTKYEISISLTSRKGILSHYKTHNIWKNIISHYII